MVLFLFFSEGLRLPLNEMDLHPVEYKAFHDLASACVPGSSLSVFLLPHSNLDTWAFKNSGLKIALFLGPFHILFPLPGTLFPPTVWILFPSYLKVSSSIHSPKDPLLPCYSIISVIRNSNWLFISLVTLFMCVLHSTLNSRSIRTRTIIVLLISIFSFP